MNKVDDNARRIAVRQADEIFRTFELYFPSIARRVADYYLSDDSEITVIMDDESKVKFDSFMRTIRCVNPCPENIDETRWRKEFSYKLLKKMNSRSFGQRELSEASGVSIGSINHYLREKSTPSAFILEKLAKALRCTVEELLDFNV